MEWNPTKYFNPEISNPLFAVIILNQPINSEAYFRVAENGEHSHAEAASIGVGFDHSINIDMIAFWTICADGGANRLYDMVHGITNLRKELPSGKGVWLPDAIIGDLDSLRSDVEDYYKSNDVVIRRDPDQSSTDFTKCLRWLRRAMEQDRECPADPQLDVVVFGGLGGRIDQAFSLIHHLFAAVQDRDLLVGEICVISEESISFVLEKSVNKIQTTNAGLGLLGENVGIIPITGPAVISTKGLEWDVKDWRTEFGGQVSTSNHIRADSVEIETSERVLFTVELLNRKGTDTESSKAKSP